MNDNEKSIPLNLNMPSAANGAPVRTCGVKQETSLGGNVQFFDTSFAMPKPREEVKFNQVGFFVYEDRRRVAVGFNITRFLEGPSIEVNITNDNGEPAGSLTVIETSDANFSLTMHLRDKNPTDIYHVQATLYYTTPENERMDVYTHEAAFDVSKPGEQ
ncbi:MAG: hypothetical protein H6669_15730 [Ardenticatenaceae bacterium]|nr:hypothetical protein [Ardenticatenaceae bacterium]